MRTFIFLAVSLFSIAFLGSCVENSQKYKALQAKADSLQSVSKGQSDEMDKLLADLNDISTGMQSIREAEHILAIESQSDTKSNKSKSQITALRNDVKALSDAINGYKEKIAKLEAKKKDVLTPKKRKPRKSKADQIKLLVRQAQKSGMKLDEIADKLGMALPE